MTTTNEVKLPELPKGEYRSNGEICADWSYTFTEDETKAYGTLCYESGLAAGRGQQDVILAIEKTLVELDNEPIGQGSISTDAFYYETFSDKVRCALKQSLAQPAQEPIDMILHCPRCGKQHIDAPEDLHDIEDGCDVRGASPWHNPTHRSHLCHGCGHIWRPADVPTNGVATIKTAGKADSPIAQQPAQAAVPEGWRLVPIEPTVEMISAASHKKCLLTRWEAMLNAAPDSGEGP